jgi:hypothetical protein
MPTEISVIFVGADGWTDLTPDLPAERITSAHGFHQPWWRGVILYHRNGYKYEVETATPERQMPPLSKLLAATFYNPRFAVRYAYRSTGFYQLEELKTALRQAIDKDSDVLTQFHGAGELRTMVERARSFDDLVDVLDYAATEELSM